MATNHTDLFSLYEHKQMAQEHANVAAAAMEQVKESTASAVSVQESKLQSALSDLELLALKTDE